MNKTKPVFILAASWRTGSTLLQRYITASGEVLVWGETGGALGALEEALACWEQITAHSSRRFPGGTGGMGEETYETLVTLAKPEHAQQWIANLTPPFAEITASLRELLLDIYGERADAMGYPRFGIKETRFGLKTARFLRTLFPEAKFIFLVRDPVATMLSIKRHDWIGRSAGISTLRFFAEHWRSNAMEFRQADFGMSLRYEDFISDSGTRAKLMDYLEINSRPPDDFIQTSRVDWTTRDNSELTAWERWWIKYWLGREMANWEYR